MRRPLHPHMRAFIVTLIFSLSLTGCWKGENRQAAIDGLIELEVAAGPIPKSICRLLLCELKGDYHGALAHITKGSRKRLIDHFGTEEVLIKSYENTHESFFLFYEFSELLLRDELEAIEPISYTEIVRKNLNFFRFERYYREADGIQEFACYLLRFRSGPSQMVFLGKEEDAFRVLLPLSTNLLRSSPAERAFRTSEVEEPAKTR